VWNRLRDAWRRFRDRTRSAGDERRSTVSRDRFWAAVREGEREAAEAAPRP
jgi:hypothetical protein